MNKQGDFQILQQSHSAYLDHAASSLTPDCVLQSVMDYYQQYRSNVHRGLYSWSAQATEAYEQARHQVASFIGAQAREVVFTSGTTASINLVAWAYMKNQIQPNQTILIKILWSQSYCPSQKLTIKISYY